MPKAEEGSDGSKGQPNHSKVHPRLGSTALVVIKQVNDTSWCLVEEEETELAHRSRHIADSTLNIEGSKTNDSEEENQCGKYCDHAYHLNLLGPRLQVWTQSPRDR